MKGYFTTIGSYLRHRSVRGGIGIAASAGAGQLIAIGAYPVLTRLYTPDDIGVLAVFISIVFISAIGASGKYEFAIPLAAGQSEANALLVLAVSLACLLSVPIFVLLYVGYQIVPNENISLSSAFLWLMPIGIISQVTYRSLVYWCLRANEYRVVAQTSLTQAVGAAAAKISLGIAAAGAPGLLIGQIIGQGGGSSRLLLKARQSYTGIPSLAEIRNVGRSYWRHPAYLAPAGFFNSASLHLAPVFIAILYGSASAGYFLLASRIMSVPMSLVGHSFAKVYLGEAPKLIRHDPKRFQKGFAKSMLLSGVLGIPVVAILGLASYYYIPIVFGESWIDASYIAVALIPMYGLQLVASPLSQTLMIISRQKVQFAWDAARLIVVISVFVISGILSISVASIIWVYSILMGALYAILLYVTFVLVKKI